MTLRKLKLIVIIVIVGLFVVFLLQNTQVVRVKFYFWDISMSRVILMPLFIVIGFIIGFVAAKMTGKSRLQRKAAQRADNIPGQGKRD